MEGARVYVVDDDSSVRRSIAFLLKSHHLSCRSFPDGSALLDELDTLDPGCILLDLRLPGRSGLDVQAELSRRGSKLPVIAMTAETDPEQAERSLAMGAIDVLEKPFEEESLLAALDSGFDLLGEEEGRQSMD